VAFEYLQHELAVEFVNLVQSSIASFYKASDGGPLIYVGTMQPNLSKNTTY
jgi:hypothetical protein